MGHVTAPELPRAKRRELEPRGHVAVPELPWAWWQELEPWGTWRLQSCPEPGGGSRGHMPAPELP
jgi:hypothetical protein